MLLKIISSVLLITLILLGVQTYRYETFKAAVKIERLEAERVARAKEAGWRKGIAEAVAAYKLKRDKDEQKLEDTIRMLRSGKLRVRERLSCPTTNPPGIGGGAERGLSPDDAEDMLRAGDRANKVKELLKMCVDILRKERK